jgi:hypothetical protein
LLAFFERQNQKKYGIMTKLLKPVLEWYEEFPEPIRSRAIKNYNLQNTIINERSVASKRIAIDHFNWLETPEGFDYWRSIYYKIEK